MKQRNWSRICGASADPLLPGQTTPTVFVKQFIDASGNGHERQWDFERQGAELAATLLRSTLRIPTLWHASSDELLHVYEYCELISVDDLLRKDPAQLEQLLPLVLDAVARILHTLANAPDSVSKSLPSKERTYGGPSTAVNFKGLDIRNLGMDGPYRDGKASFAMFDFGRPYLAPIEEAAAKFFVSIGLLNWGRPISRFLRGPDTRLLAAAAETLGEYLDKESVLAEVAYQQRTRERDVKATNWLMSLLKNLGVKTIGRAYFRKLAGWSRSNLPRRD